MAAVSVVTTYDYTTLSADIAALLKCTAEKIHQHQRRNSREIIELGADLIRVKEALGHGRFGEWFQAEFGWTIRTAQNYMSAAQAFGANCETVSYLPPKTVYQLSARSTPKNIVGEIVGMLEHGKHVDAADVVAETTIELGEHFAEELPLPLVALLAQLHADCDGPEDQFGFHFLLLWLEVE
jgi:hypothetical protein